MIVLTLLAQTLPNLQIDTRGLPVIPFGDLLTFFVRGMFVVAGLLALIYGLLGGIAWIMSGGAKDDVQAARDKIQAAIVGVFVLIMVLTIIWTLENIIFQRNICFGLSCPVTIPQLNIVPLPGAGNGSNSQALTAFSAVATQTQARAIVADQNRLLTQVQPQPQSQSILLTQTEARRVIVTQNQILTQTQIRTMTPTTTPQLPDTGL